VYAQPRRCTIGPEKNQLCLIRFDRCGWRSRQMALLALITAPRVVSKILGHLGLPSTPPLVAPARPTSQPSLLLGYEIDQGDTFDQNDALEDGELSGAGSGSNRTGTGISASPRAPP